MSDITPAPKMSGMPMEGFKDPMGLSAYKPAQEIHVPVSRIRDILHDRRKITADTPLRPGKSFGVPDRFFLDIQKDIDVRALKNSMAEEIESICPFHAAAI